MGQPNKCTVYGSYCDNHGFQHGAEAEELREGIQKLIDQHPRKVPVGALERLLESVDARDSIAYLAHKKSEETP
jgi:hypothetical protein